MFYAAPIHRYLVTGGQTVSNLLQGLQGGPRYQFCHILNLGVRLQHYQVVLRDYYVDVYHVLSHLLCHRPLLIFHFDINLILLLTWKDSTLGIVQPNGHIVVQSQMKFANRPQFHVLFGPLKVDGILDQPRYLHDQFVQVEGGSPFRLSFR